MTIQTALPTDDPVMIAFGEYQQTSEYRNSFHWAAQEQHRDGSMWAAFTAGYEAAQLRAAAPDTGGALTFDEWLHGDQVNNPERVPSWYDVWQAAQRAAPLPDVVDALKYFCVAVSIEWGHDGDEKRGYEQVRKEHGAGIADAYWKARQALAAPLQGAVRAVNHSDAVGVILAAMKDYKSKSPDVSARSTTVAELVGHCAAESVSAPPLEQRAALPLAPAETAQKE